MTDLDGLAGLAVPGPTITALTQPFWEAVGQGTLLIQRCSGCRKAVFYPRAICPHCWSDRLTWEAASGRATVKSFSQTWKPGHPGWVPAAPYYIALVELEEGPTMLTHLLTDAVAPKVGDAAHFAPTVIGGRSLPAFCAPASA